MREHICDTNLQNTAFPTYFIAAIMRAVLLLRETNFETLPPTTAVPTAETTVNSDKVVEKDGLNIHCADGASETESDSDEPQNTNAGYFAHLNMPALIVLVCIASAVIIAGVILLFSTKIEIKKREK